MLDAKLMSVYNRRLKVQEPYNMFTIRAGSDKPATELQFQMYSIKVWLDADTYLKKRVLSHYDVFVPPNLQFGNDWTKYTISTNSSTATTTTTRIH